MPIVKNVLNGLANLLDDASLVSWCASIYKAPLLDIPIAFFVLNEVSGTLGDNYIYESENKRKFPHQGDTVRFSLYAAVLYTYYIIDRFLTHNPSNTLSLLAIGCGAKAWGSLLHYLGDRNSQTKTSIDIISSNPSNATCTN